MYVLLAVIVGQEVTEGVRVTSAVMEGVTVIGGV